MNENNQDSLFLSELLRRQDARNRQNIALAGLGIRTSADIFDAAEKGFEQAKAERNRTVWESKAIPPDSVSGPDVDRHNRQNVTLADLGTGKSVDIFDATRESE
jgi:hypothetical protein